MDVFVITSPLQYICALEAKHHYKSAQNILVYIEQKTDIGKRQMDAIFDATEWGHVLRAGRDNRSFVAPKLIKQIKKISQGNLQRFFYSEYTAWRSKLFIRNLDFKQHIFFDDGTMTFFDYYDHIEPKTEFHRPRLLNDFLVRLQGCKPIGRLAFFENTEIFSIFGFPDCSISYQENALILLKNRIHQNNGNSKSLNLFIGQACIGEKGHLSSEQYLDLIKQTAGSLTEPLLYIPHRTETKPISEEIKKIKNIRFHQSSFPIEIELFMKKINPIQIFGLSSTALYTLSKLYPSAKINIVNQDQMRTSERNNRAQQYLFNYFSERVN